MIYEVDSFVEYINKSMVNRNQFKHLFIRGHNLDVSMINDIASKLENNGFKVQFKELLFNRYEVTVSK